MLKLVPILIAASAVSACQASSAEPALASAEEMEGHKAWLKQLKADDPDTARLLVRECMSEGGLFSDEGKLAISRCMRRKYDEGIRGERRPWGESA